MMTTFLDWFAGLDTYYRVMVVAFIVTVVVSLLKRLLKVAILVTILLIAIFVLRAIMAPAP